VIQQLGGGLPISYFADYIISNSGQYMFYLSIICKEMAEGQNAQVLSSTPAEAGVSTATVAASVYIDMNTTGIETIDYGLVGALASLRVSPNPTSGVITVEGCGDGFGVFGSGGNNSGGFGSGSDRGDATFASGAFGSGSSVSRSAACEISVYSSDGRLILRRRSNHIDLSAYPSGVYILRAGNKTARVVKK
jgi:hypothetical protein